MSSFEKAGGGKLDQFGQMVADSFHGRADRGGPVPMGSSGGFGYDFIHEAELKKVFRRNAKSLGRLGCKGPVFPKNTGAPFGRDDGVVRVFEDENAVRHSDPKGAATPALPYDNGDNGDPEIEHFTDIDGDGLGDVTLFAGDTGEGSRSVDKGDDGEAKAVGQTHQAKSLSIAFGVSAAEIAAKIFFCVAAFLVTKKDDALLVEGGQTSDQGPIFAKGAVSAELEDVSGPVFEVVEEVGALGMADDLDSLPRGEISINLAPGICPFFLEGGDFRFGTEFLFARKFSKFFNPLFQLGKRLFEFEGGDGFGFGHGTKKG